MSIFNISNGLHVQICYVLAHQTSLGKICIYECMYDLCMYDYDVCFARMLYFVHVLYI